MSFVARNYQEFTLELRTKQGLLYNDEIDTENDTAIEIIKEDRSFKSEITKAGSDNGIYTNNIYSEKKGENTMKVELSDPNSKIGEKKDEWPALYTLYTVYPAKVSYKIYTIIKEKSKPQISAEEMIIIKMTF